MTPEVVNLIQTVALEAIKIIGPAVIAAYATYRATSTQWELKLREVERANEFRAREQIFAHLKERLVHLNDEAAKLHAGVGQTLGYASGSSTAEITLHDREFIETMGGMVASIGKLAPLEVSTLLSEMQVAKLADTEEFKTLSAHRSVHFTTSKPSTFDELRVMMFELLELNSILGICTRLLLQKQMDIVFSPYLQAHRPA